MIGCSRCGMMVGDTIHLSVARGAHEIEAIERGLGRKVSMCAVPITLRAKSFVCPGCSSFLFEYTNETQCPVCAWQELLP